MPSLPLDSHPSPGPPARSSARGRLIDISDASGPLRSERAARQGGARRWQPALTAAAILVAALCGFWLGRGPMAPGTAQPLPGAHVVNDPTLPTGVIGGAPAVRLSPTPVALTASTRPTPSDGQAPALPGAPSAPAARPTGTPTGDDSDEAPGEAIELERERLLADPQQLTRAIELLPQLSSAEPIMQQALVLGRIADPAVEVLALELAGAGRTPAHRVAGFDMLDRLEPPGTIGQILTSLAVEPELQVRRAALLALPEAAGHSQEEARHVTAALHAVLTHETDPEQRRRAAVMLGSWYTGPGDLQRLAALLLADPDVGVRAGAAFGLERAAVRDPQLAETLAAVLEAPGEDPLVRENAWHALAAMGPFPQALADRWQHYAETRLLDAEAVGDRTHP